MSRPTLSIRRVVLTCTPRYTCVDCGAQEDGTPRVQIEVDHVESPMALGHTIADTTVSNSHMPIGWAGYGIDIHRCPECAK